MSNAPKLKKKAAELEQKRQFDKALALYVQVLEEASEDEQVQEVPLFNRVGDLLVRQGDVAAAVGYYEKAVDLYAEGGFFNNAIALCNKILRHAPGRSSVYYKLGKISARKGFKSDAKQNFLEYADRMQKEGKMDEAFRALKEFADLVPDQDDVRLMLAEQLSKKGRQDEAIEQLQQLYEKLAAEGRTAEAKATIDRMQAIDPDVVPRASGSVPVAKANDLVFLDVSFDEPVSRGGTQAPPAAAGPRGTVPMPAFDEPPALEGLEATQAAPAIPDLPLLDTGSSTFDLDVAPTASDVGFEHSSTSSMLDGLTSSSEFGVVDAGPSASSGDLLGLEPTSFDSAPIDDDDRAGLRGGLLDLDAPIAASPPLEASAFGALDLEVTHGADAPSPPPAHDLALPGDLPLLEVPRDEPTGGDLPLILPEGIDAASAPEALGALDAPTDAAPDAAPAAAADASPLDDLTLRDDVPESAAPPRPAVRRPSGSMPAPLETSDLPMLDLGAPDALDALDAPLDAPLDISPAELDLAADLGVSPAEVPADEATRRTSEALEGFVLADADGTESANEADVAPADAARTSASFEDALIMPDDAPVARASGASEGVEARHVPEEALDGGFDAELAADLAEPAAAPRASEAATDITPAELDLAADLGVAPIGTPTTVDPTDVDPAEAAAAATLDAAPRTSGARRGSSAVAAETVENLRAAVARDSEDWATRRRFAEALLEHGDREGGVKELDLVLVGYERAGDLDSARSVAEEIIRIDPNSVRHHQKRVEYAFRSNDKASLVTAYNELADALVRAGQSEKAKAVYQRVLGLAPDDLRAQAALSAFVEAAPEVPASRRSTGTLQPPRATTELRGDAMEPAPAGGDDDFVNLGDWLREDDAPKSTRMVTEEKEPTGDEQADFADMLKKFKQGVAENVEEEDYASHYDLGVAYKEMGLLDEAISEFQKALRSPDLKVRTYEALGQCFIEKNQFQVATTILGRALSERGLTDDQLVGVLYLLGFANEALGRKDDAITYYQRVFAVDIQFRDVTERLNALEQAGR